MEKKECCMIAENLVSQNERPDLIISVCKVCNCRHFEVTLAAGSLGLKSVGI